MQVMAYVVLVDCTDEYLGEDTTIKHVRIFAKVFIRILAPLYSELPMRTQRD
jgi:hypothetical protein